MKDYKKLSDIYFYNPELFRFVASKYVEFTPVKDLSELNGAIVNLPTEYKQEWLDKIKSVHNCESMTFFVPEIFFTELASQIPELKFPDITYKRGSSAALDLVFIDEEYKLKGLLNKFGKEYSHDNVFSIRNNTLELVFDYTLDVKSMSFQLKLLLLSIVTSADYARFLLHTSMDLESTRKNFELLDSVYMPEFLDGQHSVITAEIVLRTNLNSLINDICLHVIENLYVTSSSIELIEKLKKVKHVDIMSQEFQMSIDEKSSEMYDTVVNLLESGFNVEEVSTMISNGSLDTPLLTEQKAFQTKGFSKDLIYGKYFEKEIRQY